MAIASMAIAAVIAATGGGNSGWGALLGVILGWLLKTASDYFMEKRRRLDAAEGRREQRADALRSRRIESERANLLALQPQVQDFLRAGALCSRAPRGLRGHSLVGLEFEVHLESMRVQAAAILPVRARLHDRDIATKLMQLTRVGMQAVHQLDVDDSIRCWDDVIQIGRDTHESIGDAIRMLEDDQVQLGGAQR